MTKIRIKLLGILTSILLLAVGAPIDAAYARESIDAEGTFADTSFSILAVQVIGANTIITVTGSGIISGDFTGTYTFGGIITIYPNGHAEYHVIDVCECTIVGKSGTIIVDERGSGNLPGGDFQADLRIIKATGDLSNLSGRGALEGQQDPVTLLTSGTYSMSLTFR